MPLARNRLAETTSPYLQQHADNPVDWYPWNEEALAKARAQDKPILLSIGYSACHWCHVMAHESFEDPATAELMNTHFVNIKVDREERPDLDRLYQTAQALLTQRTGGWPLTMFLTPHDHIPFFGGTYFPKEPHHGLPAFKDLLVRIAAFYHEHHDEIETQNSALLEALNQIYGQTGEGGQLTARPLDLARGQLARNFDTRYGGFGRAPKFPHPNDLERLLRHWAASLIQGQPDAHALHMATFTLEQMALGGIYDHLGGGFARYSVDDAWMIPHFEKMLYDNGPLLALYAQAAAATGRDLFARTAHETAAFVMRELQSPEGGYFSSLDADSEGEEGKFYAWDPAEIKALLGSDDYPLFAHRFGLDRAPNFEGKWHLYVAARLSELASAFDLDRETVVARLDQTRTRLFAAREQRIRPGRDEKILTSWNALMIKGMAVAGRLLQRPEYLDSAAQALTFIQTTLWRDGRLLVTYKDGKAHLMAYLDDYAFLIDAILELLQARWDSRALEFAKALAEVLLTHFEDQAQGGFFFTADDHEQLIQRLKSLPDEAMPSGNGIAAQALLKLGFLLAEPRYLDAAERVLNAASNALEQAPLAHASLLTALELYLNPPKLFILRGQGELLQTWQEVSYADYAPGRLSFAIPQGAALPPALAEKTPQGETVAYLCTGLTCAPPMTDRSAYQVQIDQTRARLKD